MFQEIGDYLNRYQDDLYRDRATEVPYSALVVFHKQYYGKGWTKFFNFCKPIIVVSVVAGSVGYASMVGWGVLFHTFTAWQLVGAICAFIACVALGLSFGDHKDTEQTLIFTDKGLTVVIPGDYSSRGLTTSENILKFCFSSSRKTIPEKVVKYPPFASSPEEEMAWNNFRSYSVIHHKKRDNVSIKLWLVDDPKSGSQNARRLREKQLDCVEIYLRDDGGRYTEYNDEKSELDATIKFLNDRVSLPLYSEEQVED